MGNNRRIFKISERIHSIVATKVLNLADPRLYMTTITAVKVSTDLKVAKIYWMATGGKERIPEVDDGFEAAKGILRYSIGKELSLRTVPELKFYYDDTLDVQEDINQLLAKIR